MDLFLSVHLQKQYLLITLLINLLILFKWTLLERSLRSLLRSLVIKSLIDNIFVERLGLSLSNVLKVEHRVIYSINKILQHKNCCILIVKFQAKDTK